MKITSPKLADNINLFRRESCFTCLTDHKAFQSVCLDPFVLQVAWLAYKQHYKNSYEGPTQKNIDILHIDSMQYGFMDMLQRKLELQHTPVLSTVSEHISRHLEMLNILNTALLNC